MNKTKIEWTDYTWNPITGCSHGCWYCYAKKLFTRFHRSFEPTFHPERLKEPYNLNKPSKIFVCSVSDLFAYWTPKTWMNNVLASIENCPINHQFQLLTKSPGQIPDIKYPSNVWLGVTVSTKFEDWRISFLRQARAKIKYVSFEPLLGSMRYCLDGLNWIIVGKLTGSNKLKLDPEWVKQIIKEAKHHDIPIFLKDNLKPIWKGSLIKEFPRV